MKYPSALKREERRYRPRLSRAWIKLVERLKVAVTQDELEAALRTRSVSRVMELFNDERLRPIVQPFEAILIDALVKGGKAGEKVVNNLV